MYRNQDSDDAKADTTSYVETDPTGRYGRFDEVLGRGAMKTVYKAIDEELGLEVAWNQVKLNELMRSPDDMQRLYSEVHLLSTLKHESIIRFHTSWIDVDHKSFNFITEMFTSGTLREYRSKYRRVDVRAIKNWARQILHGIVYLHNHDPPVIHRDLKCDNIFVNGHLGQVKIGDLGLAAILRRSKSAHSVIGTPEFMAPELYEEDYNELVDVYSFGMCLLEMITCEYPYGECTNPAQIYKKVTSGKLPAAYYRIQDFEAQRFIGKCLVQASKRLSAKELLMDPFLTLNEVKLWPRTKLNQKPFLNERELVKLKLSDEDSQRTDMTITGKLNPEDDTIFLKVQIAAKQGSVENVYFPFDILHDTPLDVAIEMVKELEISDWEPLEIAEMIDGEISALIPHWKQSDLPYSEAHHTFNYQDGDEEPHHPSHPISPGSSSHASFSGFKMENGYDWLHDDLYDDTSSQSSSYSGTYSNTNYIYKDEHKPDTPPVRGDRHHHHHHNNHKHCPVPRPQNHLTRFCPEENFKTVGSIPETCYKQYQKLLQESYGASSSSSRSRAKKGVIKGQKFVRNRSLVDVRSQLLHRSLVEEVHKRRLFNTVGAVENIGFQAPCEVPKKVPSRKGSKQKPIKS